MTQQVNYGQVPPVTLGWRIQLALDYADIKQEIIASKFEVSRKTVSRWCNDAGTPPKKFIMEQIAFMCGVSAQWLIDGTADGPQPPDGPGIVRADVAIPRRARLLVVDDDGNLNEEVMQQLAPVVQLKRPVILRLTAECSATLSYRGLIDDSTAPADQRAAAA